MSEVGRVEARFTNSWGQNDEKRLLVGRGFSEISAAPETGSGKHSGEELPSKQIVKIFPTRAILKSVDQMEKYDLSDSSSSSSRGFALSASFSIFSLLGQCVVRRVFFSS